MFLFLRKKRVRLNAILGIELTSAIFGDILEKLLELLYSFQFSLMRSTEN